MSHDRTPEHRLISQLSVPQYAVLELAARAMSNDEIAVALKITLGSVNQLLSRGYTRIGARNRVDAVVMFLKASGEVK